MIVKITKPIQGGKIRAIASKSEAHRLLICASLADGETFVACRERSHDIDATANCLEALGAAVRYKNGGFYVTPINKQKINKNITLDCGESGSTLRFLRPVCGALGLRADFKMSGRLPERPLYGDYDGQLTGGTHIIPGNISSQFISGLLFALPLIPGDSIIRVTGNLESRPYVDMTLESLNLFGVKIYENEPNIFNIPGGQIFKSPKTAQAGGDWSNAAFWLAAGAIGKNGVTVDGLDFNSKQGDKIISELLARFGANVDYNYNNNLISVSPGALKGIDINAGDTPDLAPALAAVAAVAEGTTNIYNAGRLRTKESDRLSTITAVLSDLGADIAETGDGLVIKGKNKLAGGETQSFGDHRIAMTAAVVSSACAGAVIIRGAEAVKKSYPGFFDDFKNLLGGSWEEI